MKIKKIPPDVVSHQCCVQEERQLEQKPVDVAAAPISTVGAIRMGRTMAASTLVVLKVAKEEAAKVLW